MASVRPVENQDTMETIRPRSWKGFVRAIEHVRNKWGKYVTTLGDGTTSTQNSFILFRGQADSKWKLETTLERKIFKRISLTEYYGYISQTVSEVESFTNKDWRLPPIPDLIKDLNKKENMFRVQLPSYDYLVKNSHHGFPSPLLDWSESPYIASYFAYISAEKKNPAVYCYIQRPKLRKSGSGGLPMITIYGPYIKTHTRHFSQKA